MENPSVMKFIVGDRVVATATPPFVGKNECPPGSAGVIRMIDISNRFSGNIDAPYHVHFDMSPHHDDGWWCIEEQLELETPLPSIQEVLRGLEEILK